jgi:hypothetical protein
MARYYFNFRSPWNIVLDEEGLDLLDVQSAREQALASVRDEFANANTTGSLPTPYSIIITDSAGREVATVSIKDILQS